MLHHVRATRGLFKFAPSAPSQKGAAAKPAGGAHKATALSMTMYEATMNGPVPPSALAAIRPLGPQGTRLFRAGELRHYAFDTDAADDGHASAARPVLVACGGTLDGRRFVLREGRQTIGRRGDNDIVVNDLSVSAAHAWIINQRDRYLIMNTLSTNGTVVNGKRVHEAALRHGDRIQLGEVEFVFLTRENGRRSSHRGAWLAASLCALATAGALAWWLL